MKRSFSPDEPGPWDGIANEEADDLGAERSAFEWNFLDDYPDASPEQVEAAWKTEVATDARPAPPPEQPSPDLLESATASATRPDLPDLDKAGRNKVLRKEGHGEIANGERKFTNRQWDHRLRERPGQRAAETGLVRDLFGTDYVEGDLPLDLGGTGRKRSRTKAVKVTTADGESRYAEIKNDAGAIAGFLGRPPAEFASALARGRRSSEARDLRTELAAKVAALIAAGAYRRAIADLLGCDKKTVSVLEREGRLANRTF